MAVSQKNYIQFAESLQSMRDSYIRKHTTRVAGTVARENDFTAFFTVLCKNYKEKQPISGVNLTDIKKFCEKIDNYGRATFITDRTNFPSTANNMYEALVKIDFKDVLDDETIKDFAQYIIRNIIKSDDASLNALTKYFHDEYKKITDNPAFQGHYPIEKEKFIPFLLTLQTEALKFWSKSSGDLDLYEPQIYMLLSADKLPSFCTIDYIRNLLDKVLDLYQKEKVVAQNDENLGHFYANKLTKLSKSFSEDPTLFGMFTNTIKAVEETFLDKNRQKDRVEYEKNKASIETKIKQIDESIFKIQKLKQAFENKYNEIKNQLNQSTT